MHNNDFYSWETRLTFLQLKCVLGLCGRKLFWYYNVIYSEEYDWWIGMVDFVPGDFWFLAFPGESAPSTQGADKG